MDNKPYVFISYAHLDNNAVLSCVNAMKQSAINLWYDEGIEAGSEWPEFIAEKVVSCSKFVLFISKAYLNSQNCKRELNFAISRKKEILSIYLEEVELSPGMEMQLGTYQAIYRNRFSSNAAFLESLTRESFFNSCRTVTAPESVPQAEAPAPQPAVPVYDPEPVRPSFTSAIPESQPSAPEPAPDYSGASWQAGKPLPRKSRKTAAILAFFLGFLGVQFFYLRKPIFGVLCIVLCQTGVPLIAGLIHGILLFMSSDEKFEKTYKCIAS